MIQIQYDLFDDRSEISILRKEIEEVKRKDDNVRRGLFARYNDLTKIVVRLQEEIAELRGEKRNKNKVEVI
jgi:4-diphosphocytidyl-2C-methyl-D-erythritol kinase